MGQCFDIDYAEGFGAAGKDECVAVPHQIQDCFGLQCAQKCNGMGNAQVCRLLFQPLFFLSAAADVQAQLRALCQRPGKGSE
ncbi:Uncharacterised protein [Neisseria meningitidis]|nr:Uncharacterised protein [Neisseria meningitidis]